MFTTAVCVLLVAIAVTAVPLTASAIVAARPAAATALEAWDGGPRAPFTLDRLAGGSADLARFGERVVLLHFFATWCEPCRAEMQSLQKLAERYADRPLAVIGVNVAEPRPRVQRFFDANPVTFPILLDSDRAITKAWDVEILPTTIVLDTALIPVLIARGDRDWTNADVDAELSALLPESPP